MSGGIAYVFDDINALRIRTNLGTVELEQVSDPKDAAELKELVAKHAEFTCSPIAKNLIADWELQVAKFVKVIPVDYKRVLAEQAKEAAPKGALAGV